MILCFEGAPAVGKSTVAQKIADQEGHLIIPEVNLLFVKENRVSNDWYYERQVERWQMATTRNTNGKPVILDGDIFQPIWFNCMYPDRIPGDYKHTVDFYRKRVANGEIRFPDIYVLFQIDEAERKKRELTRCRLQGRTEQKAKEKIELYRGFADKQRPYFEFLEKLVPGSVVRVESSCVEDSVSKVLQLTKRPEVNDSEVFESFVDWCGRN